MKNGRQEIEIEMGSRNEERETRNKNGEQKWRKGDKK